ncbi:MAG: molybdenum ABC transporter ATP-binding protein [Planctomycetota bacterium]|nr:MAG: molybdenum ABC transporter ATP-binding protein [Planctomycetota bacterium]
MITCDIALHRGDFSLEFQCQTSASTLGIFGPSGSGKSSLLHALAGFLPTHKLRVVCDDEVLIDHAAGYCPPVHQRRIGIVFQDLRLFPHMRVAANLRYGLRVGEAQWHEIIELLDIDQLLPRYPHQCSGGQRQRIALGRALLSDPRLLLLDEPLTGLDRAHKQHILPYLERIRSSLAIPMLVVSHDLGELLSISDHIALLEQGRLRGHGAVSELITNPELLPLLHDCGLIFHQRGTLLRDNCVRLDGDAGLELFAPMNDLQPGTRVELLLRPEDLILARQAVDGSVLSVRNQFRGRIKSITATSQRALVVLDCGCSHPMIAEISPGSIDALRLHPGEHIRVLCKAQAISIRPLST